VGGDVGVDAAGVGLELVELVGGEDREGAVGGGAELEDALLFVVLNEGGAEDFGEGAGAVAAEGVHLEEAVGSRNVALGKQQVVEVGGVDCGDVLGVAGDGDGGGESVDWDAAVEEALIGEEIGAEVAAEGYGDDGEREEYQGEQDAEGGEDAAEGAPADGRLEVLHGGRELGFEVFEGRVVGGVFGIHRLERF
jgi:hypothetical protein